MRRDRTTPRRARRRPARGYSLIEMIAVITLIAILLGLGSTVLHRLVRAERAGREALTEATALVRLGDTFRADAHAAAAVRAEPSEAGPPSALTFDRDDSGPVEYRIVGESLRVTRHPSAGDGDATNVADYRFRGRGVPGLEVVEVPGGTLAVLRFSRPGGPASIRDLRVEALVGRDRRSFEGEVHP